jgi:membrane protease YdiL (CAAX protease family)
MRHWPYIAPLLPALLLEAFFYFFSLFPKIEARFAAWQPIAKAAAISLSGLLPLLLLQLLSGARSDSLTAEIAVALLAVSFWHVFLPRSPMVDFLLLCLLTALILTPTFKPLYPTTESGLKLHALSKLLWLRIGIASFRYLRLFPVPGSGFLPTAKDFRIGGLYFLGFLAILVPLGTGLGFLKWQLPNLAAWQLPFLAFGSFWVLLWFLAYGEEYLTRGILQQVFGQLLPGRWPSLIVTSVCFGAIHLSFRDQFPNWRFAALSTVAGLFYGLAFQQAQSLRAAMVTHALTVTTWNIFFGRSF